MPASIALPGEFAAKPAAAPAVESARFTLDGSDELEHHLAYTCLKVLEGIQSVLPSHKIEALLLGGGYGRGEGGVLKTESSDQPYNDLEFYVFIRGNNWLNERRFGRALQHLAHELAPEAGVEVELKIISSRKLRRSPASMFYYDLVTAHRPLLSDEQLLVSCEHHRTAQNIPLSEAMRLLMNRCSGLLFAREKLEHTVFTPADADFVCRNLAKAQLAFGDAVLTVYGQYHWSCLRRHERVRQLPGTSFPWLDKLRQHHAAGVKFKLHPHRTTLTQAALMAQYKSVAAFALKTWLWLENRRLGFHFTSVHDYAFSLLNKCPDTNPWRNRLVNAKAFGLSAFFSERGCRHPRERIVNALTVLLWEPLTVDSEIWSWLSDELQWPLRSATDQVKVYQQRWRQLS